jgi:hypothetical protein
VKDFHNTIGLVVVLHPFRGIKCRQARPPFSLGRPVEGGRRPRRMEATSKELEDVLISVAAGRDDAVNPAATA